MIDKRICIFGAGSIGCYVGGRLAAGGVQVDFIGRPRLQETLARHGLHLTDFRGADVAAPPDSFRFTTDPAIAADATLVLVAVKSAATAEAGDLLAKQLAPNAVVVSLQNGIGNATLLRDKLRGRLVLSGMVGFNVVNKGDGHFHQGTDGELMAAHDAALQPFLPAFDAAGLPLELRQDMLQVQWGKLLLNLNNPVNALAGIPLKQELSQRAYRRCIGLLQRECLRALDAAGIEPARLTPLPAHWLPLLLAVPDLLFRLLGNRMLAIDPQARSSMWEDLENGRFTEVDWLNGEVLQLARANGLSAPANERIIELIRAAEQGGRRDWRGSELFAELSRGPKR